MLGQACLAEPEHTDAGQLAASVSAALGVAIPVCASLSRTGETGTYIIYQGLVGVLGRA